MDTNTNLDSTTTPPPLADGAARIITVPIPIADKHGAVEQAQTPIAFGRRADRIASKAVHFVWEPYLPAAKVIEVGGDPERRKSILLAEIAAHVSTGEPWFDWSACPRGAVIYFSAEDDAEDTLIPRLRAAKADLTAITLLSTRIEDPAFKATAGKSRLIRFTLPRCIYLLRSAIIALGATLVLIDPLASFLDHGTNTNGDAAAREVIDSLKELAGETGCTIIVLRHLNKGGSNSVNPIHRMSGSNSFSAAARASHLVDFDPSDDNPNESERRSVLLKLKNNSSVQLDGLVFKLDTVPILCDSGEWVRVPCVEWLGATKLSATQLMLQQQRRASGSTSDPKDDAKRTHEAIEFLRLCLADGPRAMRDVQADAAACGINERTLRRAREKLGIKSKKPKRKDAPWRWVLPGSLAPSANGAKAPAAG